jgi:hypothetical protein
MVSKKERRIAVLIDIDNARAILTKQILDFQKM